MGALLVPRAQWHNLLEYTLPGAAPAVILGKIGLDQLIMAPVQLAVFLTSLAVLSTDATFLAGVQRVRFEFLRVFRMHTTFWCVAHLVTFSCIPLEYRVLWSSCANVVYVALLSALTMPGSSGAAMPDLPRKRPRLR